MPRKLRGHLSILLFTIILSPPAWVLASWSSTYGLLRLALLTKAISSFNWPD